MAEQVAHAFSLAQLGKVDEDDDNAAPPQRAIAVVQAGTGVGKSLAYSVPAIAMAISRGTRVLISTATVALQEQLVTKDLPALAAHMSQPFKFALAKGRGRYICKLKLERLAGGVEASTGEDGVPDDDLFAEEEAAERAKRPRHESEARMKFYISMADALASGSWDGDRDTLDTPPEPEVWSPVGAEAASCTGKHCPVFSQCTYYERRKELVAAQVIVANHDLLLSSLGARLLPELDNCLLVIDEAHHLPGTALSQFESEADLSRLTWIDKLASRALRIGQLVEVEEIADIPNHSARLRTTLQDTARLVTDIYAEQLRAPKPGANAGRFGNSPSRYSAPNAMTRARVQGGRLPPELIEPLSQAAHHAEGFLTALRAISKALRSEMKEKPDEARRLSTLYSQIGALAPRLEAVHSTATLLLQDPPEGGGAPAAKWFTLEVDGDYIVVKAHASPLLPGNTLRNHLWSAVRGAVLTSATLTSCGQFDFFLRESGLHGDAAVTTLEVPSPFDYAAQGQLIAVETRADPRDAVAHTAAIIRELPTLVEGSRGTLVLFSSRKQMQEVFDGLEREWRKRVFIQGNLSKQETLNKHKARVDSGEASVLFGLASFAEGVDLPGAYCEHVVIAKIPFAVPDDPVEAALAEWIEARGGNPFMEIAVPDASLRLVQACGRLLRTEEDRGTITLLDRRVVTQRYGKAILNALPPFRRIID